MEYATIFKEPMLNSAKFKHYLNNIPDVIVYILQNRINQGDKSQNTMPNPYTYFSVNEIPNIDLRDFIIFLIKGMKAPPSTVILAMIYIERLLQNLTILVQETNKAAAFNLTSYNSHKIILMAFI